MLVEQHLNFQNHLQSIVSLGQVLNEINVIAFVQVCRVMFTKYINGMMSIVYTSGFCISKKVHTAY